MRNKTVGISMIVLAMALPAVAQETGQIRGALALETALEYRERARYPESSQVIRAGEKDPVRQKRTPTRQTARGPEGRGAALGVWAAKVSVEPGRPIDLYAEIEGGVALEVTGEVVGEGGSLVASIAYADDGRGADRRAGDGIWSARLRMPAGLEPELAASYMVKVRSRLLDGDVRESVGGFLYSNPGAHLTGRYRDELRDGNLVILAEVDVAREGRFHLAGTLYSLRGEPIGTAQAAAELEPGRQWIELSFYGLMFHERNVSGPYRLGTLALATTGGMPNALNELVENAYVTRAWPTRKMTAKTFGNAQLLQAAERLEIQAAQ